MSIRLLPIIWKCRRHLTVGLWCDRILVVRDKSIKLVRELPHDAARRQADGINRLCVNLMILADKPIVSKYGRLWTQKETPRMYHWSEA